MTDNAAFLELLAGFEASLEAAQRSVTIAKLFIESQRSGIPLPASILDAYAISTEHNETQIRELRSRVRAFKSMFSVH